MEVTTPEIAWHALEPIYSLDFHHSSSRLATAGGDKDVKIWMYNKGSDGKVSVEFRANLSRHTKGVNCVRFSPNGEYLASASDGTQTSLSLLRP